MKLTNKEVIKDMLIKELLKDERFSKLSYFSALPAFEADKVFLDDKAYLLYVAYKRGLAGLKDYAHEFDCRMKHMEDKLYHYRHLLKLSIEICEEVKKFVADCNSGKYLPF